MSDGEARVNRAVDPSATAPSPSGARGDVVREPELGVVKLESGDSQGWAARKEPGTTLALKGSPERGAHEISRECGGDVVLETGSGGRGGGSGGGGASAGADLAFGGRAPAPAAPAPHSPEQRPDSARTPGRRADRDEASSSPATSSGCDKAMIAEEVITINLLSSDDEDEQQRGGVQEAQMEVVEEEEEGGEERRGLEEGERDGELFRIAPVDERMAEASAGAVGASAAPPATAQAGFAFAAGTERGAGGEGGKEADRARLTAAAAHGKPAAASTAGVDAEKNFIGPAKRKNGYVADYQGFESHGKEYKVGDCALFLPDSEDKEMYVGKITRFFVNTAPKHAHDPQRLRVQWLVRREELEGELSAEEYATIGRNELVLTDAHDENSTESLEGKARVVFRDLTPSERTDDQMLYCTRRFSKAKGQLLSLSNRKRPAPPEGDGAAVAAAPARKQARPDNVEDHHQQQQQQQPRAKPQQPPRAKPQQPPRAKPQQQFRRSSQQQQRRWWKPAQSQPQVPRQQPQPEPEGLFALDMLADVAAREPPETSSATGLRISRRAGAGVRRTGALADASVLSATRRDQDAQPGSAITHAVKAAIAAEEASGAAPPATTSTPTAAPPATVGLRASGEGASGASSLRMMDRAPPALAAALAAARASAAAPAPAPSTAPRALPAAPALLVSPALTQRGGGDMSQAQEQRARADWQPAGASRATPQAALAAQQPMQAAAGPQAPQPSSPQMQAQKSSALTQEQVQELRNAEDEASKAEYAAAESCAAAVHARLKLEGLKAHAGMRTRTNPPWLQQSDSSVFCHLCLKTVSAGLDFHSHLLTHAEWAIHHNAHYCARLIPERVMREAQDRYQQQRQWYAMQMHQQWYAMQMQQQQQQQHGAATQARQHPTFLQQRAVTTAAAPAPAPAPALAHASVPAPVRDPVRPTRDEGNLSV